MIGECGQRADPDPLGCEPHERPSTPPPPMRIELNFGPRNLTELDYDENAIQFYYFWSKERSGKVARKRVFVRPRKRARNLLFHGYTSLPHPFLCEMDEERKKFDFDDARTKFSGRICIFYWGTNAEYGVSELGIWFGGQNGLHYRRLVMEKIGVRLNLLFLLLVIWESGFCKLLPAEELLLCILLLPAFHHGVHGLLIVIRYGHL